MKSSRMRAKTDNAKTATKLLVALTGKASPAKAAEGDEPRVRLHRQLAAAAARRCRAHRCPGGQDVTGPPTCGEVGDGVLRRGWGLVLSSGAFVGHVKLMLIRGPEIKPEPPVTPVGMGKSTRGVELASVDDLDQRQAASWMKQAAAMALHRGGGGEGPGSDGRRH